MIRRAFGGMGGHASLMVCVCVCVCVCLAQVADIGHLYAALDVHIKWSERLEEEMWLQGELSLVFLKALSSLLDVAPG